MDFTEINLRKIEKHFADGCKNPDDGFFIGVEIEHFVIGQDDGHAAGFDEVEALLHEIEDNFPDKTYQYQGRLVALANADYSITLEPACQFEISISPQKDLNDLERIYKGFYQLLLPGLEKRKLKLEACGYHPTTPNSRLELIPKRRYEIMDKYFRDKGTLGRFMMRSTCSTQVSIDYFSEEDFARKFKALYRISPEAAMYFNNSRVADDFLEEAGIKQVTGNENMRYLIWQKTDVDRVDLSKYVDVKHPKFADYARFIYYTPLMVDISSGEEQYTEQCAAEVYKDREVTEKDINHIISMVFPIIRLKNFLEVRFADSMPIDRSMEFTAFIKGLFIKPDSLYNYLDNNREIVFEDLKKIAEENLSISERHYLC
ncbi:MAG: hypothetical protein IJM53_06200 [Lachnospiraceae bacterium]|nr:hypothetical protein [Lachnospiraceae bacterium]